MTEASQDAAGDGSVAMELHLNNDMLWLGSRVGVTFQRTLRIPEEGEYPLPPGLGAFPLRRVDDYADQVPESWAERGGLMLPMYQREAMWISFTAPHWHPHAVAVGVGLVNAVSGEEWSDDLVEDPQSYLVVPDQPWLDGINAGDGYIRQFVAMPLGMGYTVESEVTGSEEHGGVQLLCRAPKPGLFPEEEPLEDHADFLALPSAPAPMAADMGLGAGGRMRQEIYPDAHGFNTWDPTRQLRVFVHIANSMAWREITGEEPPPTPVSAKTYRDHGFPWFELYDEDKGDVPAAPKLAKVRKLSEIDKDKGFSAQQDDTKLTIPEPQVIHLGPPPKPKTDVRDGTW